MKIKVDFKIFLILILYLIIQKTEILTLAIIFILLHEIGHIVSGITLGLKIKKIKFTIAGIALEFANYGKERKINKIIIDFAGPFVNLVATIFGIILREEKIIYANLGLFIINMLPIYPLDGGRILKNILLYKKNYKETLIIIEEVSKNILIILSVLSSILLLKYENINIFILIIYLWGIHLNERNKNKIIKKAYQSIQNNS